MSPISPSRRIQNLDVLRGIALLGIALANVEYFTASLAGGSEGIDPALTGVDWLADGFAHVFVSGKFWTLFSLLFGMGFAVMRDRAQVAGRPFLPLYLRRTVGLLVIGLAHAWLLWAGDILVTYALTSLLLLALPSLTPGRAWRWGAVVYAAPPAMLLLLALALAAFGQSGGESLSDPGQSSWQPLEVATYAYGGYLQANALRLDFLLDSGGTILFLMPMVLGMFLVGSALVRSGAMARPGDHLPLLRRLAWLGGPAGLALTLGSVAIDPNPLLDANPVDALLATGLHMLAAPMMALAGVAMVGLAMQRGVANWLNSFAPVGRMALSNYLLQSVVGTLVFYGYGLGLWGQVPRSQQLLGALAVFAVQVLLSRMWLSRFRHGTVEWSWRAWTYWQWPPMKLARR